jgi:hypothetical protein
MQPFKIPPVNLNLDLLRKSLIVSIYTLLLAGTTAIKLWLLFNFS